MSFGTRSERTSATPGGTAARGAIVALALLAAAIAPAAAAAQAPATGAVQSVEALVGNAPPATAPPALAGVARMTCAGAGRRSGARAQATAIRCLVNRARARAGLRPMRANRSLARAASRHARDMGRLHFFSHTNTRGRTPAARARAAGWRGHRIGEALAFACGVSANAMWVVRSWLNSPTHRAIVLSSHFAQMGIGVGRKAPTRCGGGKTYALEAGHR